jgi:beta-lactamase regulating signal transducer with metallopeptidase domain
MNTTPFFLIFCELLLKSIAVLALAGTVTVFWRNASAASRHMIWTLALATLLVLPFTKLAAPRWTIGLPVKTVQTVLPPVAAPVDVMAVTARETAAPVSGPAHSRSLPSWQTLLMLAWMAGVVAVLSYRMVGSWRLQRLRLQSEPVTDEQFPSLVAECGLENRVELRRSSHCRVPLVWGLWRPVVVLPDAALAWPQERLTATLRHEFGHILRQDCLTLLLAQVVCALYWMNPLVWLATRQLRMAQEQACDDLVLRSGASAADYAELLVQTVRSLNSQRLVGRHALAMAQPSTLATRVAAIVDDRLNRGPLGRSAKVIGAVAVVALVAGSSLLQAKDKPDVDASKIQILVEAKFVELSEDAMKRIAPPIAGTLTEQQMRAIFEKLSTADGVDILSCPKVTTLSKQPALIQIGREMISPTDWGKGPKTGVWKPKVVETNLVGVTFGVEATAKVNGEIEMKLEPKIVDLLGYIDLDDNRKKFPPTIDEAVKMPAGHRMQPVFSTRAINSYVTTMPGQTVVVGGFMREDTIRVTETTGGFSNSRTRKEKRQLLVFVTARIVTPESSKSAPHPERE